LDSFSFTQSLTGATTALGQVLPTDLTVLGHALGVGVALSPVRTFHGTGPVYIIAAGLLTDERRAALGVPLTGQRASHTGHTHACFEWVVAILPVTLKTATTLWNEGTGLGELLTVKYSTKISSQRNLILIFIAQFSLKIV